MSARSALEEECKSAYKLIKLVNNKDKYLKVLEMFIHMVHKTTKFHASVLIEMNSRKY